MQQQPFQTALPLLLMLFIFTACSDEDAGTPPDNNEPDPPLIEMVEITAGTFTMGAKNNWNAGIERPQHTVTLTKNYYIGKYEVTQKQWTEVMGTNPSTWLGENRPVDSLSWLWAVDFCNKLSEREELTPVYTINGTDVTWDRSANGYRLPTEAEWEYACRAGTTTNYYSGDLTTFRGIDTVLEPIAWYRYSFEDSLFTKDVGLKQPNAYGLYDMLGNAHEFVWDRFGSYSADAKTDPIGPSSGSTIVFRSGSIVTFAENTRSAQRNPAKPDEQVWVGGLRIAQNKD